MSPDLCKKVLAGSAGSGLLSVC